MDYATMPWSTSGLVLICLAIVAYLVRLAALPKPIRGIPYQRVSAQRILGTASDLLAWNAKHGEMFGYLAKLAVDLDTPVFQVFLHPLGKPWVVIADNDEAHDIMARRTGKDFDRSKFMGILLGALEPDSHSHLPTGDAWKAHRRLVGDTMSPNFLGEVAAPRMWESTLTLIDFWKKKANLAQGRPFTVDHDLRKAAFEIIWTATFGFEAGSMRAQRDLMLSLNGIETGPDSQRPVNFPAAADPKAFGAIIALNDALNIGVHSVVPKLSLWIAYNTYPSLRAARRLKEAMIQTEIKKAVDKFAANPDIKWEERGSIGRHVNSAVEVVIARELDNARKEGRSPDVLSRVVQDELLGFLLSGNEIYTLAAWILKYLVAHQEVQSTLREELHTQMSHVTEPGASPSVSDITTSKLPYLQAVMEEVTRCSDITQTNLRTAKEDVEILGYHIPKNTEVLMLNNGPGIFTPPLRVDDTTRSKSSQAAMGKTGSWNADAMRTFDPQRWLHKDSEGVLSFNASAGPRHSFGAGPRACFGRKWADLELRIMIVLIIWHFQLEPIPEALASFKPCAGVAHRPEVIYLRLNAL